MDAAEGIGAEPKNLADRFLASSFDSIHTTSLVSSSIYMSNADIYSRIV